MMSCYREHIQYVCSDLDAMVHFYTTVFGLPLRGRGFEQTPDRSYHWVHIGTDDTYVAFRSPYDGAAYDAASVYKQDHFGVVVPDLDVVLARLEECGAPRIPKGNHPYRDRVYTRDPDGNEIEIVAYRTADPRLRNSYDLDPPSPPRTA
jgi:catechol 2,3-dioxygenase-like lactoylglutathione lyase family enzyme